MKLTNRFRPGSIALMAMIVMAAIVVTSSTANAVRIRRRPVAPVPVERETVSRWAFGGAIDEMINEDEDYSGFQFTLSHFYGPDKAVRLGLGVFDRGTQFTESRIFRSNDLVYIFDDFGGYDVTGVTLSLQGMFYSSPQRGPRMYFGLGPRFSVSDANPDVWVTYYDDYNYDYAEPLVYDDGTQIAFGLEGTVGFEWFLGRHLSMFAEYGATVQNEWYLLQVDRYNTFGYRVTDTEAFDDGIHLDASHIKLGLSLYF
jgi:hypothetical protein